MSWCILISRQGRNIKSHKQKETESIADDIEWSLILYIRDSDAGRVCFSLLTLSRVLKVEAILVFVFIYSGIPGIESSPITWQKTLGHPHTHTALSSFENPHGWLMALIISSICSVSCWNVSLVLSSSSSIPSWLLGRVVWSWLSTSSLGTQTGYSVSSYSCRMQSLVLCPLKKGWHQFMMEETFQDLFPWPIIFTDVNMHAGKCWGEKKIMKMPSSFLKLECSTGNH